MARKYVNRSRKSSTRSRRTRGAEGSVSSLPGAKAVYRKSPNKEIYIGNQMPVSKHIPNKHHSLWKEATPREIEMRKYKPSGNGHFTQGPMKYSKSTSKGARFNPTTDFGPGNSIPGNSDGIRSNPRHSGYKKNIKETIYGSKIKVDYGHKIKKRS